MLHWLDVPRRGIVPEQGGAAPGVLQQPEGGGSPLVVLGQVEEHVWKPPVLVPSEEEGCEACGVGRAELLPGKRLSPTQGAALRPALPCHTRAEAGPNPDSERAGCSPRCQGSLGEAGLHPGLGVCDCACERVRMET